MKVKYLPFLVLPLFLFVFLLLASPLGVDARGRGRGPRDRNGEIGIEEEWVDITECTATGSTSNLLVYIVQSVLSLSTILSGIFFSKKYIM